MCLSNDVWFFEASFDENMFLLDFVSLPFAFALQFPSDAVMHSFLFIDKFSIDFELVGDDLLVEDW